MNTSNTFSWEDARIFLSVTEHKSFTAAAKVLKLGQATVSRRIQILEEKFGLQLFVRGKHGAYPTADADTLIPVAKEMAKWALEFGRLANHKQQSISGIVTIAAPPGVAVEQLAPFALVLKAHEPEIQLEILSSVDYVNLSRGDADIAIRNHAPQEQGLISLHSASVESVVKASRQYMETLTKPYRIEALDWVTWGGKYKSLSPRPMLESLIPNFTAAVSSDDYLVIKAAVEAGLGACIVNKALGFSNNDLIEIDLELELPKTDFHIVCAKSMQCVPRVRAVVELLISTFDKPFP